VVKKYPTVSQSVKKQKGNNSIKQPNRIT